ncbi:MAG: hypothetical protein QNJ68_23350 [Microcoleaceae cyanobacterium MO_207.B10]|nr:hypothetical protein [Microcoleaceae cyanobacterium MO_207.B10]
MKKSDFLYPKSRYYGKATPENIAFDAKLQEFSQQVNYISNLQTAGKISPRTAYLKVEALWQKLEKSKENLDIYKRTKI